MNDKIVTCADLEHLRGIRMAATDHGSFYRDDQPEKPGALVLLDRLIAAAEADAPPLPEGWVLCVSHEGDECVRWHTDGRFYQWRSCDPRDVYSVRDGFASLTPLRPTITEAEVTEYAQAYRTAFSPLMAWGELPEVSRQNYLRATRAVFKAAGIEVSQP